MSELTYLRKLMGDTWIDAEVCAEKPTHRLGLQYKRDKNDPWVSLAEELVKEILTNPKVKFDAHVLADKIKDPYDSTLAEMESAVFLAQQGFGIVLEPNGPLWGRTSAPTGMAFRISLKCGRLGSLRMKSAASE